MITDNNRIDAKWIHTFENLDEKEFKRVEEMLYRIKKIRNKQNNLRHFRENDALYKGKTFRCIHTSPWQLGEKEEIYYCKVISGYSSNIYRVSCLFFPEYPKYNFQETISESYGFSGEGHWQLKSFFIKDVLIRDFTDKDSWEKSRYEEITEEEWKEAFDKHLEALKVLEVNYGK